MNTNTTRYLILILTVALALINTLLLPDDNLPTHQWIIYLLVTKLTALLLFTLTGILASRITTDADTDTATQP